MTHDERIQQVVDQLNEVLVMLDQAQKNINSTRSQFPELQEIQLQLDREQTRLESTRSKTLADIRRAKANFSL